MYVLVPFGPAAAERSMRSEFALMAATVSSLGDWGPLAPWHAEQFDWKNVWPKLA
jgi:hypothetical protein